MQDYRMVKHLFGATSSPSVANFHPRKAPQLNQEGVRKVNLGPKSRRGNCLVFPHASYDPVKRSMYEDDKMYVGATKKAVILAIQLRRLLEKGGFRLRKWYSNDREVLAAILESERAKSLVNV